MEQKKTYEMVIRIIVYETVSKFTDQEVFLISEKAKILQAWERNLESNQHSVGSKFLRDSSMELIVNSFPF